MSEDRIHIYSKYEDAGIFMSRPIPLHTRDFNETKISEPKQQNTQVLTELETGADDKVVIAVVGDQPMP